MPLKKVIKIASIVAGVILVLMIIFRHAQSELFTTQTNYINALFELLNAKTDLDKALGTN